MMRITMSNLYLYLAAFIFGAPILCGCLVLSISYWQAAHNVRIWRGEFQMALDQQCPQDHVNIVGGAGKVYLQAYQLDYQWVKGELTCSSDGRLIRCSCRANEGDYTHVSKYADLQEE